MKKFRALGCSVLILSEIGRGIPDVLIGVPYSNGWTALVEIKDGEAPTSQQKLTVAETKFHASWIGNLFIIKSEEEAENLVRKILKSL